MIQRKNMPLKNLPQARFVMIRSSTGMSEEMYGSTVCCKSSIVKYFVWLNKYLWHVTEARACSFGRLPAFISAEGSSWSTKNCSRGWYSVSLAVMNYNQNLRPRRLQLIDSVGLQSPSCSTFPKRTNASLFRTQSSRSRFMDGVRSVLR